MNTPLRNGICAVALLLAMPLVTFASQEQDDKAADTVSATFVETRQAAHLSKLEQMDRNPFRQQVCKHDLRLPSGWINDVQYETSDPARLPDSAQRLAKSPDSYKVAARFGVGVCSLATDSSGHVIYSVLIATYESRWMSFWRIFWE